jgi:hypothetical protein
MAPVAAMRFQCSVTHRRVANIAAMLVDPQLQLKAGSRLHRVCAMKRLAAPAVILSLLMAAVLAHADDADFDRPTDTARVSASNDIYRAKIGDMVDAASGAKARDPILVFGKAGYYLYDLDAWAMVSSGPIIGPYRSRSYSLFGSGFDDTSLNRLTMGSEYLRANASSDADSPVSRSYLGWRF